MSAEEDGAGRRVHPRLGLRVRVEVLDAGAASTMESANLSYGGMALTGLPEAHEDDPVELRIHLDDETLLCSATVVWTGNIHGTGPRCGVAFDELSARDEMILRRFIDAHSQQSDEGEA
jgi:c-di-GMP-binding flagellar brake protein YcgR